MEYILGIETTCDDTAVAVVRKGHEILSSVISPQHEIHQPFGGVFPEMASRTHLERFIPTLDEALKLSGISPSQIDGIAVSQGPGLIGSLLMGIHAAKALSLSWKKPIVGINHVEAHLYAAMMGKENLFPAIGVVLSGGHTELIQIINIGNYKRIGHTVDDAIGEAFDKVASLLGLNYPGGPEIEALAKKGDPAQFSFNAGKVKENPYLFSFSGLKTSVLYTVKGPMAKKDSELKIREEEKKDVAAAFQKAAFSNVIEKTILASQNFPCEAIYFGGGVTNSQTLRKEFTKKNLQIPLFWPEKGLSLDNAAMIAGLGYQKFLSKPLGDSLEFPPLTRMSLFQLES